MKEPQKLTEDGSIVRAENAHWVFYINAAVEPELDEHKCGKWMYFFNDLSLAETLCRKAVLDGVVAQCKHTSPSDFDEKPRGVACFYLNADDDSAHRRVLSFMMDNDLIQRTKAGKLYNISFKLDVQTRAGERGPGFQAQIRLNDFVDLETGDFL